MMRKSKRKNERLENVRKNEWRRDILKSFRTTLNQRAVSCVVRVLPSK